MGEGAGDDDGVGSPSGAGVADCGGAYGSCPHSIRASSAGAVGRAPYAPVAPLLTWGALLEGVSAADGFEDSADGADFGEVNGQPLAVWWPDGKRPMTGARGAPTPCLRQAGQRQKPDIVVSALRDRVGESDHEDALRRSLAQQPLDWLVDELLDSTGRGLLLRARLLVVTGDPVATTLYEALLQQTLRNAFSVEGFVGYPEAGDYFRGIG